MADVGAAAEGDSRRRAPILDDRALVAAEIGVVGGMSLTRPSRSARPPDLAAGGDMEHRPVDPI